MKEKAMDEEKAREVFIDPVSVNVTIKRRTDYVSMTVIAVMILVVAAWGMLTELGIIKPLSF
jgi:hypothetical protein